MVKGKNRVGFKSIPVAFLLIFVSSVVSAVDYNWRFVDGGIVINVIFEESDSPLILPCQIWTDAVPSYRILEAENPAPSLISFSSPYFMGNSRISTLTVKPDIGRATIFVATDVPPDETKGDDRPFDSIISSMIVGYRPSPSPALSPSLTPMTWEPPGESCKIVVDEEGICHVGYRDLTEAGVNPSQIDPRTIRIQNKGRGIPAFVSGEEDGRFDPDDYIEFYCETHKSELTSKNVYWLSWGYERGERMAIKSGKLSIPGRTIERCRATERYEKDEFRGGLGYISDLESPFFWISITPIQPESVDFDVFGLVRDDSIRMRALFYGRSLGEHHLILYLNGRHIGEMNWTGQTRQEFMTDVPGALLRNGSNVLTIRSPGDTESGEVEQAYLDWIELEYTKELIASDDQIEFSSTDANEPTTFRLTGFQDPGVEVYRDGWIRITDLEIRKNGSSFSVSFSDYPGGASYLALTGRRKIKPNSITVESSSTLRDRSNSADYLIIVSDKFAEAVHDLALHRSRDMKVKIIKVSDIYDEFNYGIPSAESIRDFLRYAYFNWRPPSPSYVVLVGDATSIKGDVNFIPSYQFNSFKYGAVVSDNMLVCVNGDDPYPDMFVGRIPARSILEVKGYVSKVITQETEARLGDWRRRLVFVATSGGFDETTDELIDNYVSECYDVRRVYTAEGSPYYGTRDDLIREINHGCSLVHYSGHGGAWVWSDKKVFTRDHVRQLHNVGMLPFVVSFTCFTASFDRGRGLGEELVMWEDGGAIGVLGSTGLGWVQGDYYLDQGLMQSIFRHGFRRLGAIVAAAKYLSVNYALTYDILNLFNLLGDPAARIQLPNSEIDMEVVLGDDHSLDIVGYSPARITGNGVIEYLINGNNIRQSNFRMTDGWFREQVESVPMGVDLLITASVNDGSRDAIGSTKIRLADQDEVDLAVSQSGVNVIEENSERFLTVRVDNFGQKNAVGVEISLEIGSNKQTVEVPAVKALEYVEVKFKLPDTVEEVEAIIKVDPNDEIPEANENNNSITKLILPSSILITPDEGGVLSSGDGRFVCRFSPGGVSEALTVSIDVLPATSDFSVQPDIEIMSDIYEVSFGDRIMKAQFEIEFDIPGADGDIYFWQQNPGIWLLVNKGAKAVSKSVGLFALCRSSDSVPPKIELRVSDKLLDIDEEFSTPTPFISASLFDDNGIQKVELFLDGQIVSEEEYNLNRIERRINEAVFTWQPVLSNGNHSIRLIAYDTSLNRSETATSIKVGSKLRIKKTANHPNPFSSGTWIAYVATDSCDETEIRIYTTSGRKVRTMKYLSTKAGYNEAFWDGRTEDGKPAANGVYFYRIILRSEDGTASETGKMMLWRGER